MYIVYIQLQLYGICKDSACFSMSNKSSELATLLSIEVFFLYTPVSTHTHSLSLPFAPHAPHTIILYNRFVSNTHTTFTRQHLYTNTNTREQRSMLLDLVQCHCVAEHALHITSRHNASRSIESESVRHMCPPPLSLPLWSAHGIFQSLPVRLHQSPPQASCSPSLCNLVQLLENNCPGWLVDYAERFLRIS